MRHSKRSNSLFSDNQGDLNIQPKPISHVALPCLIVSCVQCGLEGIQHKDNKDHHPRSNDPATNRIIHRQEICNHRDHFSPALGDLSGQGWVPWRSQCSGPIIRHDLTGSSSLVTMKSVSRSPRQLSSNPSPLPVSNWILGATRHCDTRPVVGLSLPNAYSGMTSNPPATSRDFYLERNNNPNNFSNGFAVTTRGIRRNNANPPPRPRPMCANLQPIAPAHSVGCPSPAPGTGKQHAPVVWWVS